MGAGFESIRFSHRWIFVLAETKRAKFLLTQLLVGVSHIRVGLAPLYLVLSILLGHSWLTLYRFYLHKLGVRSIQKYHEYPYLYD